MKDIVIKGLSKRFGDKVVLDGLDLTLRGGEISCVMGESGCGKSTLGKFSANKLNLPVVDTDFIISKKAGMSISEIFETKGEDYFRKLETKVIRSLSYQKPRVVSLGGGAAAKEKNVALMKRMGIVVFINTPFDVIYERVTRNNRRPIVNNSTKEELFELYKKREPIYLSAADIVLNPTGSVEESFNELIEELIKLKAIEN